MSIVCRKVEKLYTIIFDFRYLASGNSYNSLYYEYLIGASTIREIVEEVCSLLWSCLQPTYMPEPTKDMWLEIAKLFQRRTNFPHCLGAIDGKHVRCEKPNRKGSEYFNYKHYHSIVLMAVADANYSFIAIDIGGYGSSSDSTVFQNSNFGKRLERGQLSLPEPQTLPHDDNGNEFPYVFVGDEAFALSEHIMRPYPRRNLTLSEKVFNYRLSRARMRVECTFGILTNKWRILHRALDVNPKTCDVIIKACCILHNYVRKHDGLRSRDLLFQSTLQNISHTRHRSTMNSIRNREYLANYFTSSRGAVSWQYDKI